MSNIRERFRHRAAFRIPRSLERLRPERHRRLEPQLHAALQQQRHAHLQPQHHTTTPFFAYTTNIAGELGIAGTDNRPIDYGPPNLSFTNFGSLSDARHPSPAARPPTSPTPSPTWCSASTTSPSASDTAACSRTRCPMRTPADRSASAACSPANSNANGQPLAEPASISPISCSACRNRARFASATTTTISAAGPPASTRRTITASAAVYPSTSGFRYEYFPPYTELYGHIANLDLDSPASPRRSRHARHAVPIPDCPPSLVRPDPNDFSPRFGFAWRPSQKHNLVVRGGYSIFYSGSPYGQIASQDGLAAALRQNRLHQHQSRRSLDHPERISRRNPPRPSPTPTPSIRITSWPTPRPGLAAQKTPSSEPSLSSSNISAPKAPTSA